MYVCVCVAGVCAYINALFGWVYMRVCVPDCPYGMHIHVCNVLTSCMASIEWACLCVCVCVCACVY